MGNAASDSRPGRRRIALIGDVHANLQALQAVLADIDARGVDEICHVGDMVGFGPSPNEVVELLRRRGVTGVIGNIDRDCLRVGATGKGKEPPSLKAAMYVWTLGQLSPENRRHLEALPDRLRLEVSNRSVLLVHGSPDSIDEYIEEGISDERLGELAAKAKADVVVSGHSHKPFVARARETLFVNTGSVGRPEGGGGRSCYALLTVGASGGVGVKHYRPRYDIEAAVAAVGQAGLDEVFARMIRTGQKLKQAQAERSSVEAPEGPGLRRLSPRVRELAGAYGDVGHSRRVTRLAMSMFDQLAEPLGLDARDRLVLETGALLHDIGWRGGQAGHHKESMRMILAEPNLGLSDRDQLLAANIARYHRRALPSLRHAKYRQLIEADRRRVKLLAGLLRLADGLDSGHRGRVRRVILALGDRKLLVHCRTVGDATAEKASGPAKCDLIEDALGRGVEFDWDGRSDSSD